MFKYSLITIILFISPIFASSVSIGEEFPLFSIIPFCGVLLSIAFFPLFSPIFWHKNFGKVVFIWISLFIIPFIIWKGILIVSQEVIHVIILEYIPFILILFSLYTISGGIRIKGKLSGSPKMNASMILVGTILASWMGTTGAAMLMIRPILRANKWRKHKTHTVVFFIFLVANIGGALTPLGDPPLFLGFLQGVSFFWTTKTLFIPMLALSSSLLIIYYAMDVYYYKKEDKTKLFILQDEAFSIDGKINFYFIICVILTVMMSGFWNPHVHFIFFGVHVELQNIIRDFLLLLFGLFSLKLTDYQIRKRNGFTWFPMLEVTKLFAGIFITIIPVISMLKAGSKGALSSLLMLINNSDGSPINFLYFWMTGILSSFLDNAPTYLIFFNMAGSKVSHGVADYLMNDASQTLIAISLGSVFMGAMTYIGNAPNFMIRSISEENDVKMPSFFAYMMWSIIILVPLLFILSHVMF